MWDVHMHVYSANVKVIQAIYTHEQYVSEIQTVDGLNAECEPLCTLYSV